MLDYTKSFIEVQFPVSKVSKESYKERKANLGQTLTGLGKWWGRKPLILVRAALLGLLMPVSEDLKKDRDVFLKILTMDDEGLLLRKNKNLSAKVLAELLTPNERKKYLTVSAQRVSFKKGLSKEERIYLQALGFGRLTYDEKLKFCIRPEEAAAHPETLWVAVNAHLGTTASTLQELVQQLGQRRFGGIPVLGDCFAGGGSIPFEAARMGADVYASDLNPIAMLLTWAALNIDGATDAKVAVLKEFNNNVLQIVSEQIDQWGIERNDAGDRADAYLYCNETICPECGYLLPLAPSWVIGKGTKTVALLRENGERGFDIDVVSNASLEEIELAESLATIQDGNMVCQNPSCKQYKQPIPIASLRKDRKGNDGSLLYGLREWRAHEFVSAPDDVYHERLYCIRYEREHYDEGGKLRIERYYQAPDEADLERETKVVELLDERIAEWQKRGYIPNSRIEEGAETTRLIRERGWRFWHQLFNPRQLLIHGLFMKTVDQYATSIEEKVIGVLGINKCCNWNSKLSRWNSDGANEKGQEVFSNQALNTLFNYVTRTTVSLQTVWNFNINNYCIEGRHSIVASDARNITTECKMWITDPPYADAVNYHELSEFFLAWTGQAIVRLFPNWYADSKRALAVKGTGLDFNQSMIEIYRALSKNMPENGMQIVMFTHQDVGVWADLTMILWSSGLRVTAAWNVSTETEASGLKQGNYVKGTVLLVLRKQYSNDTAYLDELYPEVEEEVKRQIDSMRELDDKEDPNFSDADYLLASYAASLKVLTSYKQIEDIDVTYELSKKDRGTQESPIERIIFEAVKIAYDYLSPSGFDSFSWKLLAPEERFFIKGLDLEKDGINQIGAYQELARGFGVKDYKELLASTKANQARLKTAKDYAMRALGNGSGAGFGTSLLRNVLAALYQCIKTENTTNGNNWLRNEVQDYWNQRTLIVELLDFLATLGQLDNMEHWKEEAHYARLLRELVKNDGV